jgi:RNA polymerase sigma-70 factor (sigma-E family)
MSVVPEPVAPEPWTTSFIELYRAERPRMVRLAFLLTGGDPSAEELVHDAFLAVHRRWARIDNPVAYLRTSVVNACTSHHRRRAVAMRMTPPSAPAWTDAPDEMADAIGRLPERQRVAIVLRYYADLPEADIARAMGCRVPAVKSLLHRALATLREVIER